MKSRKNHSYMLPLAGIVLLLLLVRLTGCHLQPVPAPTTQTCSPTTVGTTTTVPTNVTTTAAIPTTAGTIPATVSSQASSSETTTPTLEPTTMTTASPTTAPQATPTPILTPAPTADLTKLPNTPISWWYTPGTPAAQDRPSTIPKSARLLIDRYDAIWQQASAEKKVIFLTFDEGYEYGGNTVKILDTLQNRHVQAAFFITGNYLRRNPDLVRRMGDEGHLVANHTNNHPDLPELAASGGPAAVLEEIRSLEQQYAALTGRRLAPIVRPPAGRYSEQVLATLHQAGYRTAFWSFAYRDWLTDDQPDAGAAQQQILDQLHSGSVILLHAVSDTNTTILAGLIDEIRARGYEFALPEQE